MKSNKIAMTVAVLGAVFLSSTASAADVAQQAQNPRPLHVQVAPISNLSDAKLYASSARKALEASIAAGGGYGAALADSEMDELLKIADGATLDTYIGHTIERIKNRVHIALRTGLRVGGGGAIGADVDVVLTNLNAGGHTFGTDDPTGVPFNMGGTAVGVNGVIGLDGTEIADGSILALENSIFRVLDAINTKARISSFYEGVVGHGNHGVAITHAGIDIANPMALVTIANALRQTVDDALTLWSGTIWATGPGNNFLVHAPIAVTGTAVPADALAHRGKTTGLTAADNVGGMTGNNLIAGILHAAIH